MPQGPVSQVAPIVGLHAPVRAGASRCEPRPALLIERAQPGEKSLLNAWATWPS